MTIRIKTITALLLAGAAIAATPALAASLTSGNKGPSEVPVMRDAPLTLPGIATPREAKVDIEVSRGLFGETAEAGLESLTTVTLSTDGSVDETPASDAVRAAFDSAWKGSHGSN